MMGKSGIKIQIDKQTQLNEIVFFFLSSFVDYDISAHIDNVSHITRHVMAMVIKEKGEHRVKFIFALGAMT